MTTINFFPFLEQLIAQAAQQVIPNNSGLPSVSSVDVELLKTQIEFLQKANAQMSNSFNSYVSSLYYLIFTVSIGIGLLGAVATYIFNKNLKDSTKIAIETSKREVNYSIRKTVEQEVKFVRRSIDKERIIGITNVNYFLDGEYSEPNLCKIIRDRGFREVKFYGNLAELNQNCDVLVLDFITKDFSEDQRARIINNIISIYNSPSVKFALVIYVPFGNKRLSDKLQELLDDNKIFSTPANLPITLMGRVFDAAHMSYALKNKN